MICGACPNCGAPMINEYGGPGRFQRCTCEACGKVYWLRHSNLDPVAYTEEGFNAEWVVDEAARRIVKR